jgi:hypothetical protein
MVLIGLIIIAVALMALLVVSGIRWKPPARNASRRAGPSSAGYRGGDIVSAFSSRDAGAADRLALARLDDDGAAPPVTRPQAGDSHDRDAIGRGHIGQMAGRLAETAAIASGEEAEQTPALLGAG